MRHASVALGLLAVVAVSAQPERGTLRIKVTLADAAQAPTPVQRHALLISDNPPSAAPRQIFTAADGTVVLTLRPGSYIVESDRPVVFGGRAYQWTQVVEIVAGRDLSLDLTADNAEIVPLETLSSPTSAGASHEDSLLSKYQESVVAVWSPTARASGFVVDSRGLIATDGRAIGTATVVEVQLAPTVKVPATRAALRALARCRNCPGRSKPRCHASTAGTCLSAVTGAVPRRWSGDCEHHGAACG